MLKEKTFQAAFLVSIFTHGIVLCQNGSLLPFPVKGRTDTKIEINYVKPVQKKTENRSLVKKPLSPKKHDPFLSLSAKIGPLGRNPPPFIEIEKNPLRGPAKMTRSTNAGISNKPAITKPDIIAIKKKITLPAVDMSKIQNASYISYYQMVREKIRRAAYQNYSRIDTGEVFLSFIISNDGYVRDTNLVEEKSSTNFYLREIALRSIKEASPFPNFPKELDYPQLSFNVVISFEVE